MLACSPLQLPMALWTASKLGAPSNARVPGLQTALEDQLTPSQV
jgi:hypothetical protein